MPTLIGLERSVAPLREATSSASSFAFADSKFAASGAAREGRMIGIVQRREPTRVEIEEAMEEHDRIGEAAFLERHGFSRSRSYWLVHGNRTYPSKAVFNVAYRRANNLSKSDHQPITGGVGIKRRLEALNFVVKVLDPAPDRSKPPTVEASPVARTATPVRRPTIAAPTAAAGRAADLGKFYSLMGALSERIGGARTLAATTRKDAWPERGIYFFMEPGEHRSDSGEGLRIVRIGTHAVSLGSCARLWDRLSQHRGFNSGGGNHRGSVFRKLIGLALIDRSRVDLPSWGSKLATTDEITREKALECAVSDYLRLMPFLWLDLDDPPKKLSLRAYVERNAIALLSNWGRQPLDQPSPGWLGHHCRRGHSQHIRRSGLWNSDHVEKDYDPAFLDVLGDAIGKLKGSAWIERR